MTRTDFGVPQAEHSIDVHLVSRLIAQQHPDLAHLPVKATGSGFDNAMFRIGDNVAVRMPRRATAAPLIANEQRWLPTLEPTLPVAIPAPLRTGHPGCGYPWPWSIVPWLPGEPADLTALASTEAPTLAAFLLALHQSAPTNAPTNEFRGVPLAKRAAVTEERFARLRANTDWVTPAVDAAWQTALTARPGIDNTWLHGDLHPQNVLVQGGKLTGVIDWGDITSGDPATDLACLWMLLDDDDSIQTALARYGPGPETLDRARGWAVLFGVLLADTGLEDSPRHAATGQAILRRIAAGY